MTEKTLSTRTVFAGRAIKLRVDTVATPSGRQTTREVVEHVDCVAIVAIDSENKALLVRQYRQAVGKELLEIVAGGIDDGETPEEAVIREMQEETGFRPRQIEKLGGFYSAPGFMTEYLYLYLATDLVPGRLVAEDTESIKPVRLSLEEIPGLITSGKICDAKSIAGLLTYLYLTHGK